MQVSHAPVSRPNRSMVAIAWEIASCRYPFSCPITSSLFFGGLFGGVFCASAAAAIRRPRIVVGMISVVGCGCLFTRREQIFHRHPSIEHEVEEPNHHLVPALI